MPVALPSWFSGFSLSRKRSQDFGWGFAGGNSGGDGFDGISAYDHAAAVKPVSYVCGSGGPFKVFSLIVEFILINMMDYRKIKWIWKEGNSDQSVDHHCFDVPSGGKLDFHVAGCTQIAGKQLGSDIPSFRSDIYMDRAVLSHISTNASDASKSAGLVYVFISRNVLPHFSRQTHFIKKLWLDAEQMFDRCFNVEFIGVLFGSAITAKVSDKISIVSRVGENLRSNGAFNSVPSMVRFSSKAPNSTVVRDFIDAFVSGHRKPLFGFIHGVSSMVLLFPKNKCNHRACWQSRQVDKLTSNFKETVVCR